MALPRRDEDRPPPPAAAIPALRGPRCTQQGLSGKREPIGRQRERVGGIVHQSAGGKGKASQSNSAQRRAQVSFSVLPPCSPQRRFVPSAPVPFCLASFRGLQVSERSAAAAPRSPNTLRGTGVAGPAGGAAGGRSRTEEQDAGARAAAILWG